MAQITKVLVKRQCKDQVWYEAIDLDQYKWEQTHGNSIQEGIGGFRPSPSGENPQTGNING